MPKRPGDRTLSRVKLRRVLARLARSPFTSTELQQACREEQVKYDTVQRALQRQGMIAVVGVALAADGTWPRGSPPRTYRILVEGPVRRPVGVPR